MKNSTILAAAVLLFSGTAFAQHHKVERVGFSKIHATAAVNERQQSPFAFTDGNASYQPSIPVSDNGSLLVTEDFSKFTTGSEDAPDMASGITGPIDDALTTNPGWYGENVYSAGGCISIGYYDDGVGLINLPACDLSANNGVFYVKFRAKVVNTMTERIWVLVCKPGQREAVYDACIIVPNQWQEFTIPLMNGEDGYYVQMWSNYRPFFIDDVELVTEGISAPTNPKVLKSTGTTATLAWDPVEGADSYMVDVLYFDNKVNDFSILHDKLPTDNTEITVSGLDTEKANYFRVYAVKGDIVSPPTLKEYIESPIEAPELLSATDYTPTSITLNWKETENATGYLLTAFSAQFNQQDFILLNEPVSGTSYSLTNLRPGVTYYYKVAAQFADGSISKFSAIVPALPNLEQPIGSPATNITENSFTANWQEVQYASNYEVTLYKQHTATADNPTYEFINAQLDDINSPGTVENPQILYGPFEFDGATGAYGWYINSASLIQGGVGLDNTDSQYYGLAYMYSPQAKFGQAGGKVTVTLDIIGDKEGDLNVAFANPDSNNNLVEVTEGASKMHVTTEWTEVSASISGGGDESVILIRSLDDANVFFRSIKAQLDAQPAGSTFETVDRFSTVSDLSCDFEKLSAGANDIYGYSIVAVLSPDGVVEIRSIPSEKVPVQLLGSTPAINTTPAKAYVAGTTLYVNNPERLDIEVYTVEGRCLYSDRTGRESASFELPMQGIYIVKVGASVFKLLR